MPEKFNYIKPESNRKESDLMLINSPLSFSSDGLEKELEPSFGQLRIVAVLEKHGLKPSLLDLCRHPLSPEDIENVLFNASPKMVGLNPTSINIGPSQIIAEICKKLKIPLIIGGVHSTLDPKQTLHEYFPDAQIAVRGKGEYAVLKIVNDTLLGKKPQGKGVYYTDSDFSRTDYGECYPLRDIPTIDQFRYIENPLIEKEINFDGKREMKGVYYTDSDFSRTDYGECYPLRDIPTIDQFRYIENPLIEKEINFDGKREMIREISLYVTAGCPFDCAFCSTPVLVGKKYGERPFFHPGVEKIMKDIDYAVAHGANAVHFLDDMAITNQRQLTAFYHGIQDMGIADDFYWRGMTRAPIIANQFQDQDLKNLHDSGCWRLAMGVESGNQEMLDKIRKGITKDQVRIAVYKLKNSGISQVKAFFIMGFPDETNEQLIETYNFIMELKELGLTDISLFQFKPYPGTELWEKMKMEK